MAHLYEARTSDGETYNVSTNRHHDDHSFEDFKRHLLGVIKGSVSGVIGGSVVHFLYKGRR